MHNNPINRSNNPKAPKCRKPRIRMAVLLAIGAVLQAGMLAFFTMAGTLSASLAAFIFVVGVCCTLAVFAGASEQLGRMRNQASEKDLELQFAHSKIEQLIRHDPLTGVLNRRTLIEMLDGELLRSRRTGHPFSFAIIDLDHFRVVNEKFGHPVGDTVLKTVSDTSMKLLRALDRFGRLGGEEFGIVLPATWLDQGAIAMARLAKAVAGCDWESIVPGMTVTFSAGITTNALGDTAESVIRRAEQALLQAKQEGRNRTVQAEEPLPEAPPADLT